MTTNLVKKGNYRWTETHRHNAIEAQKRRYKLDPHPLTGTHLSSKWRANISKALKEYYRNHEVWNRGKSIHSEETRKQISKSCKRSGVGKFNKYGKKVKDDDTNDR